MSLKTRTISVLIPCFNEEKMIRACIQSCLRQTRRPDQIVVVNDGSTDGTARILEEYKDVLTLITLPKATGNKSRAQEAGIGQVRGEIVIMTDGDTVLDPRFVEIVERDFEENPDLAVVAGHVRSTRHNALTALRDIDYVVSQDVYKSAQARLNFISIIPGCAGAFKTRLFKEGVINFEHDTLTEDLDFTYKVNKAKLPVKYNEKAVVYTSDPFTFTSYVNQMRRWYGGTWQNLQKHLEIIVRVPGAALMLPLLYIEGLIFALTLFVLPFINFSLFIKILLLYTFIQVLISVYAAVRRKRWDLLLYGPACVFIAVINSYIFIEQFFLECVLEKRNMVWFHPERRVAHSIPIYELKN